MSERATLLDSLSLLRRYLAISMRAQLQYRAALIMQGLGQLFVTGIEFVGIWALFARFGSLRGWSLREVGLLYGMVDVAFALADAAARGFDVVGDLLKSGELDRLLLRPRSTVLQLVGHQLRLIRAGRLAQGAAILVWAGAAIAWTPARLGLLVLAIAGMGALFFGLVVLQATSCFWTVETLEVWNAFTYGGNYAAQYPMSIYRPWFRTLFTAVIPLLAVGYLPALAILDHADPLGLPEVGRWLGPLAGFVFLALSLWIWQLGLRRHASTGS
jgi:ABC-2 type transport system permease protein